MSFELDAGLSSGFQPFFLMPLLIAGVVLCAEIENRLGGRQVHIWLTFGWLVLPMCLISTKGGIATERYLRIIGEFATPGETASLLLVGLYGYGLIRKFRSSELGLIASLLTLSLAYGTASSIPIPRPNQTIVAVTIAALLMRGFWSRSSLHLLLAIGVNFLNLSHAFDDIQWLGGRDEYYWFHLSLLLVFAVGYWYRDKLANAIRSDAAWSIGFLALFSGTMYPSVLFPDIPLSVHFAYLLLLTMFAYAFWQSDTTVDRFCSLIACVGGKMILSVFFVRQIVEQNVELEGARWLIAGFIVLAIGMLLSLTKGGVIERAWQRIVVMHHRQAK